MKIKLYVIAAILAVLLCLAYFFRIEILLTGISIMTDQRVQIGPSQDVEWEREPQDRSESIGKPNIVLILADDLGWNDLTINGGGVAGGTVPTPNIDSIAKQGMNFVNGYAGQGTCAPSRAMMMTGRYGSRFGFEFTPTPPGMSTALMMMSQGREPKPIPTANPRNLPYDQMGLPATEVTIAELLKDQGYYTAHIGKWHLGRESGSAPQEQGFDQSLLMHSGLYA